MSLIDKHQVFEKHSYVLIIGIIVTIMIGGLVEILPLFRKEVTIEKVAGMRPYTPLELAGFNIYIREGCYNCHSQQIRPLRDEVARYGHYSLAAESMYDHPFQWGSKRTGPDLARVGGKYSDDWHVNHMVKPTNLVPESIMPSYSFLLDRPADISDMVDHLKVQRIVGVPYSDDMIALANEDARIQAAPLYEEDTSGLEARYGVDVNARDFDGNPKLVSEMDALIAYLQVLGTMAKMDTLEKPMPEPVPELAKADEANEKAGDTTSEAGR